MDLLYFILLLISLHPMQTAGERRAPITSLPAFSSLASCVAKPLSSCQAYVYNHNCQQEDIEVAASCLCLKTGNIATLTGRMWTAVSARCKLDASEEFSSGLQALTLYCASAMNPGAQDTVTKATKPTKPGAYIPAHFLTHLEAEE